MDGSAQNVVAQARKAVFSVYDVRQDDARMRAILDAPPQKRAALFDRLRKEYPRRREFFNTRIAINPPNPTLEAMLEGIGFASKVN